MSKQAVDLRTAYILDYLPVRARNRRVELVSEMVPCFIEVADGAEPAINFKGKDGSVKTTAWAHDGTLYGTFLRAGALNVEEFQNRLRSAHDSLNQEYGWLYRRDRNIRSHRLPSTSIFSATPRESLKIKEIFADERTDGLAYAEKIAKLFIIKDGTILTRLAGVPHIVANNEGHDTKDPNLQWRFNSMSGCHIGSLSRSFRCDDIEGIRAWWSERTDKDFPEDFFSDSGNTCTKAGIAADNTLAWWTISSAEHILRPLSRGKDMDIMTAGGDVIRALADLKDILDRSGVYKEKFEHTKFYLPSAADAAVMADEVCRVLEQVVHLLDNDPFHEEMTAACRYILEQNRYTHDLDEIAAFAP